MTFKFEKRFDKACYLETGRNPRIEFEVHEYGEYLYCKTVIKDIPFWFEHLDLSVDHDRCGLFCCYGYVEGNMSKKKTIEFIPKDEQIEAYVKALHDVADGMDCAYISVDTLNAITKAYVEKYKPIPFSSRNNSIGYRYGYVMYKLGLTVGDPCFQRYEEQFRRDHGAVLDAYLKILKQDKERKNVRVRS